MTVNGNIIKGPLSPCGGGGPCLSDLLEMQAGMDAEAWRRVSDTAQVVASYLACHPAVEAVRYPGLTSDATYHEASCTLRGGFGPFVDVLLASGAWMRYDARRAAGDARDEVLHLERVLAR